MEDRTTDRIQRWTELPIGDTVMEDRTTHRIQPWRTELQTGYSRDGGQNYRQDTATEDELLTGSSDGGQNYRQDVGQRWRTELLTGYSDGGQNY
ncbi:Hypothetical predicted protein [Pelobates cultripes]|uniref:Uncharacterized protein n=1 Tax=Pelobates cultripes TaxID=61616 RepID=A0AAD1SKG3_PELCU|nr:Hypothetical predicted protein [Pelobates cultripes]